MTSRTQLCPVQGGRHHNTINCEVHSILFFCPQLALVSSALWALHMWRIASLIQVRGIQGIQQPSLVGAVGGGWSPQCKGLPGAVGASPLVELGLGIVGSWSHDSCSVQSFFSSSLFLLALFFLSCSLLFPLCLLPSLSPSFHPLSHSLFLSHFSSFWSIPLMDESHQTQHHPSPLPPAGLPSSAVAILDSASFCQHSVMISLSRTPYSSLLWGLMSVTR